MFIYIFIYKYLRIKWTNFATNKNNKKNIPANKILWGIKLIRKEAN